MTKLAAPRNGGGAVRKRKTPLELRGELLKRATVVDLTDESQPPLTDSTNTSEVDNVAKKPGPSRNPRYTNKRVDEAFPAKKPRFRILSGKENTKENQPLEKTSNLKNLSDFSNSAAERQQGSACLENSAASSQVSKHGVLRTSQTIGKCSLGKFLSVAQLSSAADKSSGLAAVDVGKALRGLATPEPRVSNDLAADSSETCRDVTSTFTGNFFSECHVPGQKAPLDLTLKTSMRVVSSSPVNCYKVLSSAMPIPQLLVHVLALLAALSSVCAYHWLSKPLVGDECGRIYVCSDTNFFAFESNGSIAWTMHMDYKCSVGMAPVHGGPGKIYLVADNRILMIKFENTGASEPAAEVFFGPQPGQQVEDEIIGLSVSTLSSTVFINIKNRGLFAYRSHGRLLWSVGPVLYKSGYRQGCTKNLTDCYFASVPMLDQCEASIYISNTEGELYCLSIHGRHFRWIQDFSYLDKNFTITPGNNGHLYVTVPVRALVLALDVFSGNVLWQRSIGPLSKADCAPVVDSNGWVSIGSLDGFLYSFSPAGVLKKFSRRNSESSVVQVGRFLDCSGFAVYSSQIEMEGKVSHTVGEYTTVSAIRPKVALLTVLVPATGSIYWSENNPGQLSTLLSKSDLSQFVADEEILLAFLAASKNGNLLQCRTTGQKLASSCSQARTKLVSIYTGNERVIVLFLLFESTVLAILIGLVRFCCTFWGKKKLQDQGLGSFLSKRCSLQHKKKALGRTITELDQKAVDEAVDNEVLVKLGSIVQERESIERKLSTTYSLGRDNRTESHSRSMLPLYMGKTRSYSFQGVNQKNMTMFHTLSDTSSSDNSTEGETSMLGKDSSTNAEEKKMLEDSSSKNKFRRRR